jgi:hypothetical protein
MVAVEQGVRRECQMSAILGSNGFQMASEWLSDGFQMGSNGFQMGFKWVLRRGIWRIRAEKWVRFVVSSLCVMRYALCGARSSLFVVRCSLFVLRRRPPARSGLGTGGEGGLLRQDIAQG